MLGSQCDGLTASQTEWCQHLKKGPGTAWRAAEHFAGGRRLLISVFQMASVIITLSEKARKGAVKKSL